VVKQNESDISGEGRRRKKTMPKQLVEVIDRHGHVVQSTVIELDHEHCVDAEYEEVALILAEKSGRIEKAEHVHLRATCVR